MSYSVPSSSAGTHLPHKARPLGISGSPQAIRFPKNLREECRRIAPAKHRVAASAEIPTKKGNTVAAYDLSPGNGSAFGTGSEHFFKGIETVGDAMTSMVVVATPDTMLGDILEHFAFYTGLPVADERTNHLLGMVTNIDMYKKQRGKAASVANTRVREVMTSPVVAVYPHTLVSYAAGLMLKYKVHRLPVVDRERRVVGIVTRKDLFQTLTASREPATESFAMVP